jgi:type II secretory pathway pseudopilin PulG
MEPTELNEKPKFNWQRLLITVGIVIVTAGAIGGSVYYVMNQQAQKDKESAEKTAQDLQKQVADLQKTQTKTVTTTTPATTTTDPTTSWKTFTDSSGTVSFKYPENWYAVQNQNQVVFSNYSSNYVKGSQPADFMSFSFYVDSSLFNIANNEQEYKDGSITAPYDNAPVTAGTSKVGATTIRTYTTTSRQAKQVSAFWENLAGKKFALFSGNRDWMSVVSQESATATLQTVLTTLSVK